MPGGSTWPGSMPRGCGPTAPGPPASRRAGMQPQHGGPGAEQRQHALDGARHDVGDVQALGQRLGQAGQLLGLVAAARGLGVELRVLQSQRRLVGEGLQQVGLGRR